MKNLNIPIEDKDYERIKKAKELDKKSWLAWLILSAERSFRENGRRSYY